MDDSGLVCLVVGNKEYVDDLIDDSYEFVESINEKDSLFFVFEVLVYDWLVVLNDVGIR